MAWQQFCSRRCQYQSKLCGKKLCCSRSGCGRIFYRRMSDIRKVNKSYCSRKCAALVNNKNKPLPIRKNWHQCGNEICGKQIPRYLKHCSRACYSMARTAFTREELIIRLKNRAWTLHRTPAKREMRSVAEMCIRAFGSWNKSLIAAGLTPHRSHSQRMYKRMNTVALDGHKCDSISEALVDNWLTKNNVPHDRNVPYPGTNHKADWRIQGNIFVEYFGLANDSPRYDRSLKEKKRLCVKNGIQLIEVYPNDLYPVLHLENKFLKIASGARK